MAAGILLPRTLYAARTPSAKAVGANDRLNVALVGCRSMGWYDLSDIMQHPGTSCVALCDIDNNILESRADGLLSMVTTADCWSETILTLSS